jgi:diaminopimelate epimerase
MKIPFCKYQGTGNDFIMIDNRVNFFDTKNKYLIENICHRRFGVGSDGLILIENSILGNFYMRYYNSDGNEGSMCGNGGRCAISYANELGIISNETEFYAVDGLHKGLIIENEKVSLLMQDVKEIKEVENSYELNTGSPHYVVFVDNLEGLNVVEEGKKIRYNTVYKRNGINVNFVEILNHTISVRTYERGVEDETYSCGTGVTAVAIVCAHKNLIPRNKNIEINTKGGLLEVSFEYKNNYFSDIWLSGPASKSFEGTIELND